MISQLVLFPMQWCNNRCHSCLRRKVIKKSYSSLFLADPVYAQFCTRPDLDVYHLYKVEEPEPLGGPEGAWAFKGTWEKMKKWKKGTS